MAWIELHQALFTHRKTVEAADILDIPEVYVVGHLSAIWSWALDNAPDGRIKTRPRLVERVAQWKGSPGDLLSALIEVGFMEQDGDDLIIHDWMDYAGRLIDKRQKNTERMRNARAKTSSGQTEDMQDTCDAQPSHVQGLPYRTVPNPTVPNRTVETDAAADDPFMPQDAEYKPGKIDLKAILADRPHWAAYLEKTRPAPKAGQTAEGFDRWKVCQWLNGKEEAPTESSISQERSPESYRLRRSPEQIAAEDAAAWAQMEKVEAERKKRAAAFAAQQAKASESMLLSSGAAL
jgi:hypothetical protein